MRGYPKIDEAEIAERKRLRPLFSELYTLAQDYATGNTQSADERARERLIGFMTAHGFEFGDLVALRERPYHWDRFNAERWAWLLHRVMNIWKS